MGGHFDFVTFAAKSDVGRKRKNNEDNFGTFPSIGVWLVADGMGGGDDGEVASAAVVRAVDGFSRSCQFPPGGAVPADMLLSGLCDAIDSASKWIRNRTNERNLKTCASTVVGVALDRVNPGKAIAFHAGDSRLYRIRGRSIKQITRDHSAAEAMGVKDKKKVNPLWQNVITRAVGLKETTDVERTEFAVKPGDRILICSDGLSGMVPDKDMLAIIRSEPDVAIAVDKLIDAANAAGGVDNVTVELVQVGELPKGKLESKTLKEVMAEMPANDESQSGCSQTNPTCPVETVVPKEDATDLTASNEPPDAPSPACVPQPAAKATDRFRFAIWALSALIAALLVALVTLVFTKRRAAEKPRDNAPRLTVDNVPTPEVPAPSPDAEPSRVPVPQVAKHQEVPAKTADPVPAGEATVTNVVKAVEPPPAMAVISAVEDTPVTNAVESVAPDATKSVDAVAEDVDSDDADLKALADAFEKRRLSRFESVVKSALRAKTDGAGDAATAFAAEMRKVHDRASAFVSEARFAKGASRNLENLMVDFKYALGKADAVRGMLPPELKADWNDAVTGDAKSPEVRRAAVRIITEIPDELR